MLDWRYATLDKAKSRSCDPLILNRKNFHLETAYLRRHRYAHPHNTKMFSTSL